MPSTVPGYVWHRIVWPIVDDDLTMTQAVGIAIAELDQFAYDADAPWWRKDTVTWTIREPHTVTYAGEPAHLTWNPLPTAAEREWQHSPHLLLVAEGWAHTPRPDPVGTLDHVPHQAKRVPWGNQRDRREKVAAMVAHGWGNAEIASVLGVQVESLRKYMRSHGITRPAEQVT